jgi:hypothetical protein
MSNWIFLSKNNKDPFINQFAAGCRTATTDTEDFIYEDSSLPLCFRGILKKKIIKQCWKDHRDFYYMDTGYFGNETTENNPNGYKVWHRIVRNNLQHSTVIKRPADRWESLNKKIMPWKKDGRKILIAAPDEKPCKFYDIKLDDWLYDLTNKLKQYTDRPIEIRQRSKLRIDRTISNTLQSALDNDVFALITYNSNAATESILYGIPAFVLAPVSAALPVSCLDISKIENPFYPSDDERFEWACHLAYGQFNIKELRSGKAKEMLEDLW